MIPQESAPEDEISAVEALGPNLTLQRIHSEADVIYKLTITGLDRPTIDLYIKTITDLVRSQPQGQPLVGLTHFKVPQVISKYLRERMKALAKSSSGYENRIISAVVLPKSTLSQVAVLFIRQNQKMKNNKIFFNVEDALVWLKQTIAKQQQEKRKAAPEIE
jgi:hypothetical protein